MAKIIRWLLTITSNESKKNCKNNTQIIMAACTWPSSSNVSQKLKKAKYLRVTRLLSRLSVPTTLHGGIVSKLPTQAWNKAKISPHTPLKTALSKRENHSTNDAFWLVESRDAHRLVMLYQATIVAACCTLTHSSTFYDKQFVITRENDNRLKYFRISQIL